MPDNAVAYPLGAPTISNSKITVDMALQQPKRITQRLSDITLQKFIVDKVFTSGAPVVGGALIFDKLLANDIYLSRDIEARTASNEYPVVGSDRRDPEVAKVEDYGGKFKVADETKKRNDKIYFDNQVTALANTIVRKVNQRATAVLDAAIAGVGSAALIAGHNWTNVTLSGNSPTPNNARPFADIAAARLAADKEELGVEFDMLLVNPQELASLTIAYGEDFDAFVSSAGVEIFASNRVTAGTAYILEKGKVGVLGYEEGLTTETYDERKTRSTWVQSYVNPLFAVTNPYSIKKITGLAA
jgi:hypothetical protein